MADDPMLSPFPLKSGRPFKRDILGGPWKPHDREKDLLAVIELDSNEFGEHVNYIAAGDDPQPRLLPGQFPINHFPGWIDKLGSVYASPPFRTFRYNGKARDPEGADVQEIEALYRDASADAKLRQANRMDEMTGNAVGVVGWSDRRKCPVIQLWHGGEARVQTEDGDPQSPVRIVLRNGDESVHDWRWEAGSKRFTLAGAEQVLEDPFLHFFRTMPNKTYMVPGIGLALGGIAVALISDGYNALGEIVLHQAFAVWKYHGNPPAGTTIKISPRTVIPFPPKVDGQIEDLESVTPDTRITEVLDVLDQLKRAAQEAFGIPATLWDAADDASGAQTVESRAPLLEYRKAASQTFVLPETMLLRKMLALAVHNGRIASDIVGDIDAWDVEVAFVDPMTEQVMEEEEETDGGSGTDGGPGGSGERDGEASGRPAGKPAGPKRGEAGRGTKAA